MTRGRAWTTGLVLGLVVGITVTGCGEQHSSRPGNRQAAATSTAGQMGPNGRPTPSTGPSTWPAPAGAGPTGGSPPGSASPSGSASASGSPYGTTSAPAAAGTPTLPSGCEDVLTSEEVDRALGWRLGGDTQFIRGVPQPSISRTGRVTCRYGVAVGGTPPNGQQASRAACSPAGARCAAGVVPVELGLATYPDAEAAAQRVDFTVHQEQTKGARQSGLTVLDKPAVLLVGDRSDPLLVMADGGLTLALSVARGLAPADRAGAVLGALAEAVVRHLH